MHLFRSAARPIGRLGTNLLNASAPLASSSITSRTVPLSSPQSWQTRPQRRSFQATSRRQASVDVRSQETSEAQSDANSQSQEKGQEIGQEIGQELSEPQSEVKTHQPSTSIDQSTAHAATAASYPGALWDLPEDRRIAHLEPPWRPRDLHSDERKWYVMYGPDYPNCVQERTSRQFEARAAKRAKIARFWKGKLGSDWYETYSEANKIFAERQLDRSIRTTDEYRELAQQMDKVSERLGQLRTNGALDPESPLSAQYKALNKESRALRKARLHLLKRTGNNLPSVIKEVLEQRKETSEHPTAVRESVEVGEEKVEQQST